MIKFIKNTINKIKDNICNIAKGIWKAVKNTVYVITHIPAYIRAIPGFIAFFEQLINCAVKTFVEKGNGMDIRKVKIIDISYEIVGGQDD